MGLRINMAAWPLKKISIHHFSDQDSAMDIVYHNGTNGSKPWVEFYPYTPSATAGYAFMAIFGIATVVHLVLMCPFRAAYFIPLVLGGVCTLFFISMNNSLG